MKPAPHEIAVDCIRGDGPMTMSQLAEDLAWSTSKTGTAVRQARRLSLLKRIGKDEYGRQIFAAVQTETWP